MLKKIHTRTEIPNKYFIYSGKRQFQDSKSYETLEGKKKKSKDIGDCHLTHVKLLSRDFDSHILSRG